MKNLLFTSAYILSSLMLSSQITINSGGDLGIGISQYNLNDITDKLTVDNGGITFRPSTITIGANGMPNLVSEEQKFNILIGYLAGFNNISGEYNNFFGASAGYKNTTGSHNNFFGHNSGFQNDEGEYNNFFGAGAGHDNTSGSYNNFFGQAAGYSNKIGAYNNFFGRAAGQNNDSGSFNNFFGHFSGHNNKTGNHNNFLGNSAGSSNTSGNYNNFFGLTAGYLNKTGSENNFLGRSAGQNNDSGHYNNFIGYKAGFSNIEGHDNNFIGKSAGHDNISGNHNNFLGDQAGASNETGHNNIYIGYQSGNGNKTGSNNICIGSQAGYYETGSNKLYIDNSSSSNPLIYGDFSTNQLGINRVPTQHVLEVSGNASKASGGEWQVNSDIRLKKNILPLSSEEILDKLLQLQGITYEWNDNMTSYDRPEGIQYGFIAQNIRQVFPELVSEDNKGYLQTSYGTYDAMYVEAIRALEKARRKDRAKISTLETRLQQLESILMFGRK